MGSGLILFAIVFAWLAVLIPMALRSHDNSHQAKSADRFSHAMRVLSRRSSRDVLVPRRKYSSLVVSETRSERPARIPEEQPAAEEAYEEADEERVPLTPAQRRSRTLAVLVGLALVTLGLWLAGVGAALYAHVVTDLLAVAFVVHCRRQAVLRAQQRTARPRARAVAPAARPAVARPAARPARIAGIPDRMPARPAPLTAPLPAPAARYEDRPAVAATGTDSWEPVPVPVPTYVTKPTAPRRETRVLDLTKPGEWTAALEGDDVGLGIFEEGPELEDIIERRRAAGDW